jgi:hypothetical protein
MKAKMTMKGKEVTGNVGKNWENFRDRERGTLKENKSRYI